MKPQRLLTMSEVCNFDGSKREKTNGSKRENLTVLSEAPPPRYPKGKKTNRLKVPTLVWIVSAHFLMPCHGRVIAEVIHDLPNHVTEQHGAKPHDAPRGGRLNHSLTWKKQSYKHFAPELALFLMKLPTLHAKHAQCKTKVIRDQRIQGSMVKKR